MNNRVRGALASLVMGAGMVAATVMAQDKATLASEKDKVSYAIGLDVARSFQPIARDIDFAAMEKALANAMAGGKPLQSEEDAQATHAMLQLVMAVRTGQRVPGLAPGSEPPAPSREQVGLLMGAGQFLGAQLGSRFAMRHGTKVIKPLLVTVSLLLALKLLADPSHPLRTWPGS